MNVQHLILKPHIKRDFYYKVFGSRDHGPKVPLLALLSQPIKNRNSYFEKYYSDEVSDDETFEFTTSQTDQCEKESYCFQLVETITLIVINHRNQSKKTKTTIFRIINRFVDSPKT